jgi:uncharacterized low-complexity protein
MKRYRVYESHLVDAAAPIGYGHHAGVEVVKHADVVKVFLQIDTLTKQLEEAKCGEALCGHDHSTQYWELRANKAECQATDAQEAIGHYQAEVFKLTQQLDAARADIEAGLQLSGSFFAALKPILTHVDVQNPGRHITELIADRDALQAKCGELEKQCDFYTRQNLALLDRWSNGYTVTVEQERDAAIASLTACRAQETWLRKGCSILIEQTSSTYFKQDDARLAQVMEWRNSEPQAQPHAGEG